MSSSVKRLRIFAGPNGSGKSTLAEALKNHNDKRIKLGIFVNADLIEQTIRKEGSLNLNQFFRFQTDTSSLRKFIEEKGMSPTILNSKDLFKQFSIRQHKLYFSGDINSYIAADIAAYIRKQLILNDKKFSFETVFSHPSKLAIMKEAKAKGYRIYFYFITTDDPLININRVKVRVAKNGHPVPDKKITDRYYKSLELLLDAIKLSDRAYLFDNSGKHYELVAEVVNGKTIEVTDYDRSLPNWFINYVYKKLN